MLIDITLKLNPQIADNAPGGRDNVLAGHCGGLKLKNKKHSQGRPFARKNRF